MQFLRFGVLFATIGLLLTARADDAPAEKAGPLERKALDAAVHKTLREIINQGADLYNSGDTAGCYRLYEGSLRSLRPLLDHRPELQAVIAKALEDSRETPEQFRRAFVLREAIDRIREAIRPTKTGAVKGAGKKSESTKSPVAKTLWDRLGGRDSVAKVVDEFMASAAADPKVNFFRDEKTKPDAKAVAQLKTHLVELISSATGGPLTYTGRTMKEAHKGMKITAAEFDALAVHFEKALVKYNAAEEDVRLVMSVIAGTKKDIVESKPAPPSTATLWDSLGGEKKVATLVDDFMNAAVKDPKVNFSRDGKFKLDDAGLAEAKKKLVDLISSLSGGPRKYTGKSMKAAHEGMGITDAEFDALGIHLKAALEKNGIKADDAKAVQAAIESTRKSIVEKKPEEKKTPEKKAPEKKASEKKDVEKKAPAKKTEEKKTSEKE